MDSTFITVMLILFGLSAAGLVIGRYAKPFALLWLTLISLFCVYGFISSSESGRGMTYYHIGYALIAVGCLGSGTRLCFTKEEECNTRHKELADPSRIIRVTFLAGLAGAAAAFAVSVVVGLLGGLAERLLNTTVEL